MATITLGGTAQNALEANPSRRGYSIQNQSTASLWIRHQATATADASSLEIPAGALYETPPDDSAGGTVSIIGATTGQAFFAKVW